MDHSHAQDHGAADHEGPSHLPADYSMSSLLDGLPEPQHNQLLEMLHVPLLHGGVKEAFLLPAFTTYNDATFALACILLAITSCILELLRLATWHLERHYLSDFNPVNGNSCSCKQCASIVLSMSGERKNYNTMHNEQQVEYSADPKSSPGTKQSSRLKRWMNFAGVGVLQFLTYQSSTLLMLVAMTMNIFLIISLGMGATLGKLISLYVKRQLQAARK